MADPINQRIPNLINGVSQQPTDTRLPDQAESVINCSCSVMDMLGKRPPLEVVARVGAEVSLPAAVHYYRRDAGEKHFIVTNSAGIRAIDQDGAEAAITAGGGYGYLSSPSPDMDHSLFTYKDTTFLANNAVVCAMSATLSPVRLNEGVAQIKGAVIGASYGINIIQTAPTATVYTGGFVPVSTDTPTTIAAGLAASLIAAGAVGAGYVVVSYGNVVYVSHPTATYKLEGLDNRANTQIAAFQKTVQKFSDLPAICQDGYIVNVLGDTTSEADNIYYKFLSSRAGNLGTGQWQESVAPGIPYAYNTATMPHTLVRTSPSAFTWAPVTTWGDRQTGDINTNPDPSFIGNSIAEVFLINDRLGFLSNDSVCMSRTQETNYYKFFQKSSKSLIDSDPINTRATSPEVVRLNHAMQFDKGLVLFGTNNEFIMRWGDLLSPKTASITPSTQVGSSRIARPKIVNSNILFVRDTDAYSTVFEMSSESVTGTVQANETSVHVQAYLPKNILSVASPRKDLVVFLSKEERSRLYVHNYFWQGQQKVQNAFHRWDFDSNIQIVGIAFDGLVLNILYNRTGDGLYLGRMDCSPRAADSGFKRKVYLDQRLTQDQVSVTYNPSTGVGAITLPYPAPTNLDDIRVVLAQEYSDPYTGGTLFPGMTLPVVSVGGNQVLFTGNLTGIKFYVGLNYTKSYELSELVYRENNQALTQYVQKLLTLQVDYYDTGYLRIESQARPGGEPSIEEIGSMLSVDGWDALTLKRGRKVVPLGMNAEEGSIRLVNDSHMPSFVSTALWYALPERRSSNR